MPQIFTLHILSDVVLLSDQQHFNTEHSKLIFQSLFAWNYSNITSFLTDIELEGQRGK